MIKVGKAVWYDSELFGKPIRARVYEHVEGWYQLIFSDGSKANVPPSRVTPRKERPDEK